MSELPSGTVTFLFTDIEGSTRLLTQMGESYAEVLEQHRQLLRAAFPQWSGHEVDTQGDSFFVAFGRASDAVAAAVQAQRAVIAHPWPTGGHPASVWASTPGSRSWRVMATSDSMFTGRRASPRQDTEGRYCSPRLLAAW